MNFVSLVESLVAQQRRCGRDLCQVRNCARCRRGRQWRARIGDRDVTAK